MTSFDGRTLKGELKNQKWGFCFVSPWTRCFITPSLTMLGKCGKLLSYARFVPASSSIRSRNYASKRFVNFAIASAQIFQ
jgi:hypothetical protein